MPTLTAISFLFAPDCSVAASPLQCRLSNVLGLLYIAAALLAIVLIGVVVAAVRSWKQNEPDKKDKH